MKTNRILKILLICLLSILLLSGCSAQGDITDETNNAIQTAAPQYEYNYIGNVNTKVFHAPSCRSLPDEKNQVYFGSCEEAILWNYSPCKKCNP